jgi:uncharacterized membrane protein (UPF0127 family)
MIRNLTKGVVVAQRVERCATFWTRGRGLMFRRGLADGEALLFVEGLESVLDTSIHMLFVFFSIGVIWLDKNGRVVDKTLARPFGLYYAPRRPAQYFVEGLPQILELAEIGDQLQL